MKNRFIALFLLVFISFQSYAQSSRELFQQANELVKMGRLEKAREKYLQVIRTGDAFYIKDSEARIDWINHIMLEADKDKPFSVSDTEIIIPYQGGQDVVTINGSETWSASFLDFKGGWCEIKQNKGKIYIVCTPNESTEDRLCKILIEMGDRSEIVTVKNSRAPEKLVSSVESMTFPSQGDINTFEIYSNTKWEITDYPEWISAQKDGSKIILSVKSNEINRERSYGVKVESASKIIVINIFQSASLDHISFSKNNLYFNQNGGEEDVKIYTDASEWDLSSFPHWCHVSKITDNTIRIRCAPNEANDTPREASINITTGNQTMGVLVSQEAKPYIAKIPMIGQDTKAVSLGIYASYMLPLINASCDGNFTGSVVNYSLGNVKESVSYKSTGGLTFGCFADIRLYKNLFLTAGVGYSYYSYSNDFSEDVERIIFETQKRALKGIAQNSFQENYHMHQLEVPVLLSYRIPMTINSHMQFNIGPVVNYGLAFNLNVAGNVDGEQFYAYEVINHEVTDKRADAARYKMHDLHKGFIQLYGNYVEASVTATERNAVEVDKNEMLDAAPYKRLNFGARVGISYEYACFSVGVEYSHMLMNMANTRFWEGDRWMIFDQPSTVCMAGYKQYNNYLQFKIAYTFRYNKI